MSDVKHEILREAIARNSGAVLSLPIGEGLRHFKTRFLGEEEKGLWIDASTVEPAIIDQVVSSKSSVGMAFKAGQIKSVFATRVLRRESALMLAPGLRLHAILLEAPERVEGIQRRSNYRVLLPAGAGLNVRAWKIPDFWILRDKPSAKAELSLAVRDMSTGGVGLFVQADDQDPSPLKMDQRLRLLITYSDVEALVDSRVRFVQDLGQGNSRIGVQFTKLDADVSGRQTLSRLTAIFGVLRRDEVRRLRQDLMAQAQAHQGQSPPQAQANPAPAKAA